MAVQIGSLLVQLGLESGAFKSGLAQAEKDLNRSARNIRKIGAKMQDVGAKLSLAVTAPLVAFAASSVRAAQESREAIGQVDAALASMGKAAGRSSEQLQALASKQMRKSLYDDDEILRKVTANLLTFGNIAGQQFDRAQQAVIDLSARLGQDLQSSTLMVGKALNDPVKGLAALRRVGIQFTAQQEDQIKAMIAAGDAAGAQAVMLSELERQFGGAAEAARKANPFAALKNSFDDLQETVGEKLLPVLVPLVDKVAGLIEVFARLPEGMQSTVIAGAAIAAALGPVLFGIGGLIQVGAPLLAVLGKLAGEGGILLAVRGGFAALGAALGPIGAIVAAVAAAGYLIYKNWDLIAPVLQEAWKAFSETLGPPLRELISAFQGAWNEAFGASFGDSVRTVVRIMADMLRAWNATFGPPVLGLIKGLVLAVAEMVRTLGSAISTVRKLLTGDFAGASQAAFKVVNALFMGLPGLVLRTVNAVGQYLSQKLGAIWKTVTDKIETVKSAFKGLYIAVVGNSYVPDMIDGIAAQMQRLDAVMVNPAKSATERTKQAFEKLAGDVRSLMDELFPEARALAEFQGKQSVLERGIAAGGAAGFSVEQLQAGLDRLRSKALDPLREALADLFGLAGEGFEALGSATAGLAGKIGDGLTTALEKAGEGMFSLKQFGGEAFREMAYQIKGVLLGAQSLGAALRNIVATLASKALDAAFSVLGAKIGVPGFATGTNFAPGGLALVGERGPELVNLRRGAQVIPANDTARMLGGNLTINVSGPMSAAEARQTGQQVALAYKRATNGPMRGF